MIKKVSKINRKIQSKQIVRQSSRVFELMGQEEEEIKRVEEEE